MMVWFAPSMTTLMHCPGMDEKTSRLWVSCFFNSSNTMVTTSTMKRMSFPFEKEDWFPRKEKAGICCKIIASAWRNLSTHLGTWATRPTILRLEAFTWNCAGRSRRFPKAISRTVVNNTSSHRRKSEPGRDPRPNRDPSLPQFRRILPEEAVGVAVVAEGQTSIRAVGIPVVAGRRIRRTSRTISVTPTMA